MTDARGRSDWIVPGLAQILEIVLDAAGDQRNLTTGERDRIFATGERAHDAGGSLSQLIEAYLAGAGELWENIFGVTDPGRAVEVGRTLRRVSENAVAGLAAGYESAQRRSIHAAEALRTELIHDLLSGGGDPAQLADRARFAGIDPATVHVVVVAERSAPVAEVGPLRERIRVELASRAPERPMITVVTAGRLVVLAPAASPDEVRVVAEALRAVDDSEWRCGVGLPCRDLAEVHRSYDEAREAVRLGRIFELDDFVVHDALLAYRLIASDHAVASALVDSIIEPLDGARGDLVETLAAFVEHGGNMAAMARELNLGPRSVAYRLDRITEITGHSPREPHGRLTLELALRCRRLVDPG